jgi:hypothetical protein
MNKKIQELAEQAGLLGPSSRIGNAHDATERFAELIVRECVKVMYDNAIERKVPPDINQTPTHYAIAVLEHFGVGE